MKTRTKRFYENRQRRHYRHYRKPVEAVEQVSEPKRTVEDVLAEYRKQEAKNGLL